MVKLEVDIERALSEARFELWFEPQCHVDTGEIHALEGLLRLRDDDGGVIAPDEFIGIAEANGLITPLTDLAMDQAAAWCARWREAGRQLRVSVNLSQTGLRDRDIANRATAACRKHRLATSHVTVELTETALAHDHATLLDTMIRLRRNGFQLALDDFGRGYASLHELRSLPFDELKLDKDIVQTAIGDARCRGFLESTLVLASSLSLRVVAEGVETREMFDFVSSLGCEYAQGHWIAQPMPGAEVLPWLERRIGRA